MYIDGARWRPVWGATAAGKFIHIAALGISIHAPAWGATALACCSRWQHPKISIHAPRMGSDPCGPQQGSRPSPHFYPRPPHGERQYGDRVRYNYTQFLSTPPAWGATRLLPDAGGDRYHFYPRPPHGERRMPTAIIHIANNISIHAPRMGSDQRMQSRVPTSTISIHAPRMGSDGHAVNFYNAVANFYPRPPHGERRGTYCNRSY